MDKIFKYIIRYGLAILFFALVIGMIVFYNFNTIRNPDTTDETAYKNLANNFTIDHIKYLYQTGLDTKPVSFLFLEKILDNANPVWTRTVNIIFIIIITIILYDLTKNKLASLYFIIPVFLDSMWLTVEIIEVLCVLLAIRYVSKSGIFIGITTIIRPTSILYTLFLKKDQIKSVLIIGTIFAIILLGIGLFFPYLQEVINYSQNSLSNLDMSNAIIIILALILLIIMGLNKEIFKYCVMAIIPLHMRLFPHYFVPIFSFLFLGFLMNMNDDIKNLNKIWYKNDKIYNRER